MGLRTAIRYLGFSLFLAALTLSFYSDKAAFVGAGCLYALVLGASLLLSRNRTESSQTFFDQGEKPLCAQSTQETCGVKQYAKPRLTKSLEMITQTFGLAEQEHKVLKQLLEGRTLSRIARDLFLSIGTVKRYTQKIYRAFDVHSRTELLHVIACLQEEAE